MFTTFQNIFLQQLQPSQKDLKEKVVLKLEAVWVPQAPRRAPEGREPVGGSGGIPPQEIFEIWMLKGAIWCNLGDLKGHNCILFAQLYLP